MASATKLFKDTFALIPVKLLSDVMKLENITTANYTLSHIDTGDI